MTESDAMAVQVQLTPDDGPAYQRMLHQTSVGGHYELLVSFAISFFVLTLIIAPELLEGRAKFTRPLAVMASLPIAMLPFALVKYLSIRDIFGVMHDPRGFFLRPHHISVSSRGVSFKSEIMDLHYDWQAFLRHEETPTHFFLHIDKLAAYVVPKRDFENEADANRFRAILRANIKPSQPSA
jgi:hypothetical protein